MSLSWPLITIAALLVAGALSRLLMTGLGLRAAVMLPRLAELDVPAPPRWPLVSMLVPACNEGATIEGALRSKLAQDYPELEVVVVDDRSTDGTGAAVDRLADADERVRAIHLLELPQGWLGKVHALERGMAHVGGDWILLSDADVFLAPTTLRRAVAYAEHRGLDFLTLLPEFEPVSLAVDAALADLVRSLLPMLQPDGDDSAESRFGVGGGAFMLVRRSAYERTPGFEHLKLEVIDDMALGQMVKGSGARTGVANGRGLARIAFYTSLADLAIGSEKAFASAGRCSVPGLLLFAGATTFVNLSPLLLLVPPWPLPLRAAGAVVLTVDIAGSIAMSRYLGGRVTPAVLAPIGAVITAAFLVRSAWLAAWRGGVLWRGTLYRTAELRAGMRYRFPWS